MNKQNKIFLSLLSIFLFLICALVYAGSEEEELIQLLNKQHDLVNKAIEFELLEEKILGDNKKTVPKKTNRQLLIDNFSCVLDVFLDKNAKLKNKCIALGHFVLIDKPRYLAYDSLLYDIPDHEQQRLELHNNCIQTSMQQWLILNIDHSHAIIHGDGSTILTHMASGYILDPKVLDLALQKKCDPNVRDNTKFGNTPLTWAIANDSKDFIEKFIRTYGTKTKPDWKSQYPIDLDMPSEYRGNTPLILSIAKGHHKEGKMSNYELTKLLLEKGADPNKADEEGNTPLHIACLRAEENTVKLLLGYGANPTLLNINSKPPIDHLYIPPEEREEILYKITGESEYKTYTPPIISESAQKNIQRFILETTTQ